MRDYKYSSNNKRESWVFKYDGREILPYADSLYKEFSKEEQDCRKKMSALIENPKEQISGENISKLKTRIEWLSAELENLSVWITEFARLPDHEYTLNREDIIYFGMVNKDTLPSSE